MKKKIDFEDFLSDKCDTHTNNDPAGFERWLEQLDGDEYMNYAQEYGKYCFVEGSKEEFFKWSSSKPHIPLEIDEIVELIKNQGNINC